MVIGQHKSVLIFRDADQRRPEGRLTAQIADLGALGGAQRLDLVLDVDTVQLDVTPRRDGIGGDDLHRLVELVAESGHQVGVPVDHGLHRGAQAMRVERAAQRDRQL